MALIYEDLTHELIGCSFDVHNSLGVGYDENAYHKALERRLGRKGITYLSEARKILMHRDRKVREFKADLIVSDKIILELKALQAKFLRANYVQIISELKLWQMRLGLLVNFGLQKVQIERIPFTEKARTVRENFDYVRDGLSQQERATLAKLRDAVLNVSEIHGLGYDEITCRKLVEAELEFQQIKFQNRYPIKISYEGESIGVFKMKPLLIGNRMICDIKALTDTIDFYDIAKIQSCLKALKLKVGIIVNFGKTALEIRGVRSA
ncbi:MAG: GxxExxY protein [candidate division KSB1 bacterium]|nr:GxxExxY protein [candidate division KSB1 bacterium]MDZ7276658.1 GxxExxY protein [candidate division KSB1 bacterium]MDZ7288268.1 GxxExxY protein [candidate division KSB1 bacterium]MDZ7300470.1 GxxExxY protein [candidate division KSB1 bacterium]MDZ7306819.1 GxxExxY protein [candidate division KSB1 bacterium]